MDPNANLAEQETCTDSARLRELRQALAQWLRNGGFEPNWATYRAATVDFCAWCRRYGVALSANAWRIE
jgi:hypothetical protein